MKSAFEALPGALSSHAHSTRYERRRSRRYEREVAEHQAGLARALTYQLGRARSPEQCAQLEAEYERRMAQAPDRMRTRRKSDFMDAPLHRLTRDELVRLRSAFNGMARESTRQKAKGKHRGIITRTAKDVMGALLYLAERYPRLFPSLERLASIAECCKQSVVTALRCLEQLGFITRHRRLQRLPGLLGFECAQATNAYELHMPGQGLGALAITLFRSKPESNSSAANAPESLSYLRDHPETWGAPGIARGDAYGDPPKAGRF